MLEARGPRPPLPAAQGRGLQAPGRRGAARSTASASTCATGETLGPRRRVGLRQDDDAASRSSSSPRRRPGRIVVLGRDVAELERGRPARDAPRRQHRLPGSDGLARPAHAGQRHPRRADAHARHVAPDKIGARIARAAAPRRPATPSTRRATRSSSRAASASASGSPARSRSSPSCSCSTSRCPRWTSRSRRASSTCSRSCGPGWACPICSSRTTSRSSVTSPTGSP